MKWTKSKNTHSVGTWSIEETCWEYSADGKKARRKRHSSMTGDSYYEYFKVQPDGRLTRR